MILIDWMGHMVSDTSAEELHVFAEEAGLERHWYQTPKGGERNAHYDLTTARMREKARRSGAYLVEPKELVCRAWWNGKEEIQDEKRFNSKHNL